MIYYIISDAKFWTAVAFIIFILLIIKPVKSLLIKNLDDKIKAIKNSIQEGETVNNEAKKLFAKITKKQNSLENELSNIWKDAELKINNIEKESNEKFDNQVIRRKEIAKNKIAQLELEASEEIKEKTIDLTIMITKNIINNKFKINYKDKILQRSLLELSDSIKN